MDLETFLNIIYERYSGNVKLGLDRIKSILDAMSNPQAKLKGFHIAGTNGKGSTSAMCESIAIANNERVGLNTSPHLVDYRERIRINRANIDTEDLFRIYNLWKEVFDKYEASFFEITTAMAFYYFAEQNVETAIFEVGLGGRLDGTNCFIPNVSCITTIAIDHPKSLGDTIEKIAYEKAGIIKKNVPLVVGKMPKEAYEIILNMAEQKEAKPYVFNKDFFVSNIKLSREGTYFDFNCPVFNLEFKNIRTNLLGEHQVYNATVAIMLSVIYQYQKFGAINRKSIVDGLNSVLWNGRMQVINEEPLIIIDGAHNDQAVEYMINNLKTIYNEKFYSVISILRDKNFDNMISKISTISGKMFISKNDSKRAADIDEQMLAADKTGVKSEAYDNIMTAFNAAVKESDNKIPIFVTGSFYTISEVINGFKKI